MAVLDVGQAQAAAKHRFHIALLARLLLGFLHVLLHARVAGEVAVDVILGQCAGDIQLLA